MHVFANGYVHPNLVHAPKLTNVYDLKKYTRLNLQKTQKPTRRFGKSLYFTTFTTLCKGSWSDAVPIQTS